MTDSLPSWNHALNNRVFRFCRRIDSHARQCLLDFDRTRIFIRFVLGFYNPPWQIETMMQVADNSSSDDLSEIVLATLGTEEASISGMLKCIAERMNAFGSALWEIAPNAKLDRDPPEGFLITVASWWESGDLFALDDVPLADSPSTAVAVRQKSLIVPNIREAGGAKRDHPFWKRHNVRGMCAVPIKYLDGSLGVLNVYRREGAPPFTEREEARLEKVAALVPGLFRAVREKIGLRLVSEVERVLRDAERTTKSASSNPARRPPPKQ